MKKNLLITLFISLTLLGASSFIKKSSTGITGMTGSPGEQTCASCHSGGSSATKGVTITAIPSFSANQYMADSTYQINVQVGAVGFSRYGFDCEILDSVDQNAGTMQNPGAGVQIANHFNGRKNAFHTTKKVGTNGVTFTFKWIAPSSGQINFYVCGNAVNNNNTTTGDLPLPKSLTMYPAPVDSGFITGVEKARSKKLLVSVFPNPVQEYTTLSFFLKESSEIQITLLTIEGKEVKKLYEGPQEAGYVSQILNLSEVPGGIYFIKTSNGQSSSQKLITVQ